MGIQQTRVYTVKIEIEASSKEEAEAKLSALSTIEQNLALSDLMDIANMIESNPTALPTIKSWLENPPIWMKPVLPMFKKLFQ